MQQSIVKKTQTQSRVQPQEREKKRSRFGKLMSLLGVGLLGTMVYSSWATAQVPPTEAVSVGISIYLCYDPSQGKNVECPSNPNNAYDGSGNYFVDDPENYDYNSDPSSYPNQTFGDEYIPQRQQYLLLNSIYNGENNQQDASDNFNKNLPAILDEGKQAIAAACDNEAYPAYDNASSTFAAAKSAYQNAANSYQAAVTNYQEAAGNYQTASGTFNAASGAPYIYDQLVGANQGYADLSTASASLATAEQQVAAAGKGLATAQSQYAQAQQQSTDATKAGLNCQATLSVVNSNIAYNAAQTNTAMVYAMGQNQQGEASQKQSEVSAMARDMRGVYGLQQANSLAIQGLVPNADSIPQSPRPTQY
jgi:hypothetical protein